MGIRIGKYSISLIKCVSNGIVCSSLFNKTDQSTIVKIIPSLNHVKVLRSEITYSLFLLSQIICLNKSRTKCLQADFWLNKNSPLEYKTSLVLGDDGF